MDNGIRRGTKKVAIKRGGAHMMFGKQSRIFIYSLMLIITFLVTSSPAFAAVRPGPMTVSVKANFNIGENIQINWTTATDTTRYGCSVWKYPYTNDSYLVFDQYVTGTSINIGSLPAGDYRVQMMAYGPGGNGPASNMVYFKVANTAMAGKPGPMSVAVKSSFNTGEAVQINWTAAANTTRYGCSVWKYPYTNDNYLVFDQYVTGTSINIGSLPVGDYRVQMMAYGPGGNGPASNMVYFKVANKTNTYSAGTFIARTTEPNWNSGIYALARQKNPYWNVGNCVVYAWGRTYEITGKEPPGYMLGNATDWWNANINSRTFPYGYTPKLGAVVVFNGHVAVVEAINGSTVTVSNSSYKWGNYSGFSFKMGTVADISRYNGAPLGYIYIR